MKKFKHKTTKYEATYAHGVYVVNGHVIPAWMIENSSDWIEQVEHKAILTSEDGVELYEGEDVESLNTLSWEIESETINKYFPCPGYIYFSTREAAERYRMDNAQKLSLNPA